MEYNFQTCRDNRWEKSDSNSKELAVQGIPKGSAQQTTPPSWFFFFLITILPLSCWEKKGYFHVGMRRMLTVTQVFHQQGWLQFCSTSLVLHRRGREAKQKQSTELIKWTLEKFLPGPLHWKAAARDLIMIFAAILGTWWGHKGNSVLLKGPEEGLLRLTDFNSGRIIFSFQAMHKMSQKLKEIIFYQAT